MMTTTGTSAATEALGVMSAVTSAHTTMTATRMGPRLMPARSTSTWPSHAVTPVLSSASLTTKSDAIRSTAGSPKPAVASSSSTRSVAHNERTVPTAMIATGMRFDTKSATTTPRMMNVMVLSLTASCVAC